MLWILVRKELLANLLTLRLGVAFVFTVVLAAMTTFAGSLDYSLNFEAYQSARRQAGAALEDATVYQQVEARIVVPPLPLSIFGRGVLQTSGQSVDIGIGFVPLPGGSGITASSDTDLMKNLIKIDFVTVVALLLSFLAVVLGFDAICGERERGTLVQMLSNPVPRAQVVVAKLLGGMISLWLPFAVAFTISLLIALANPDLVLAGGDWVRLGIFFALSCLFLGQVYALTLMVSSFARHSDTALIVCLFAWLLSGVGYMNFLPSSSRYGVEEKPHQEFIEKNNALWRRYQGQVREWEEKHPSPGALYVLGLERQGRLRYVHPRGVEWLRKRNAFRLEKVLERAEASHKVQWDTWKSLADEAFLVDEGSILSPFTNYQVLSYLLAQTTLNDKFFFVEAAQRYRRTFIEYLRGKKAFSSRRWFTDDPPGQEALIPDPESLPPAMRAPDSPFVRQRLAWAREQEKKIPPQSRGLDLSDMPRFGAPWKHSLGASLAAMMPGLAVLLLSFGAAVLIGIARFLRYDPR